MLKADTLVLLVNSLTKAEKKNFKRFSKESAYLDLFQIIEKGKDISTSDLRLEFLKKRPQASFDVTVSYLYQLLLDSLLSLREEQDNHYLLFNKTLKARILFEKSLFEESLDLLNEVKEIATQYENNYALLYASRLELEYLLFLNFPNVSETALLNKHFKVNEILKTIRKVNEQSSLYELLKHRILYKGVVRSKKQKDSFNDLVVSEMSIVASSNLESFEIKKLHQLFQSNYLIEVGDYKSALHSFYELNNLFERNKHLWANPPAYYLLAIEGILDNLRSINKYVEMSYFINQLKMLNHSSIYFQANVSSLLFLYELFSLLDFGDFHASKLLMKKHQESLLDKIHLLSLTRQAEVSLYTALIYLGNRDFKAAQKSLLQVIIRGKSFYLLPLYRTIRLVNLMIHYETGNTDVILYETRSIKRELKKEEKAYRVEHLMIKFLNKQKKGMYLKEREKIWEKMEPELEELRNDIFEIQMLKLFDFTAWIESKLCKTSLQKVLLSRKNSI